MNKEKISFILIYFKCKGFGQPIRNLLCYLDLPFSEIHFDRLQEEQQTLPQDIIQYVRSLNIDEKKLPILLCNNMPVEGLNSIMNFLCKKANLPELCGTDIKGRARVQEMMQVYVENIPKVIQEGIKYAQYSTYNPKEDIDDYSKQLFEQLMNRSKFIKFLCQYLDQQKEPKFIFGNITIVDFMAMETFACFLGIFDHEERIYTEILESWVPDQGNPLSKPNAYYISVMKSYRDRIVEMPFYKKHKAFLQSFTMFPVELGRQRLKGFKKMWIGDPNCIH